MKEFRANVTSLAMLPILVLLSSSHVSAQDLPSLIQGARFVASDKSQSAFSQKQAESYLDAFVFQSWVHRPLATAALGLSKCWRPEGWPSGPPAWNPGVLTTQLGYDWLLR